MTTQARHPALETTASAPASRLALATNALTDGSSLAAMNGTTTNMF
jgi:hypothetical protein